MRVAYGREHALAVDEEHRWLPALAPLLPLPIPVPLAEGAPGSGYPFAWTVNAWIGGAPATSASVPEGPHA